MRKYINDQGHEVIELTPEELAEYKEWHTKNEAELLEKERLIRIKLLNEHVKNGGSVLEAKFYACKWGIKFEPA